MPTFIRLLENEDLIPVDYQADSLADAARHEPDDGVYTVTNTYHTFQVLKFDAHLDRLEDSARRAGIPFQANRPVLRQALHRMIEQAAYGDVRFRITVPRTGSPLILSLEPFKPPAAEVYERGVRCMTAPGNTRRDPNAKTTDWMHRRAQIATPSGIYEVLLVDGQGSMLEGSGSNFYAILEGELRSAGEGVLSGIAQQVVYTVASNILPVRKEAINVVDLPHLSEAMISSASRGIVPVVEIDGVQIGAGVPGEMTKRLRSAYLDWVASHLEQL